MTRLPYQDLSGHSFLLPAAERVLGKAITVTMVPMYENPFQKQVEVKVGEDLYFMSDYEVANFITDLVDKATYKPLTLSEALTSIKDGFKITRKCWVDTYVSLDKSKHSGSIALSINLHALDGVNEWSCGSEELLATDYYILKDRDVT